MPFLRLKDKEYSIYFYSVAKQRFWRADRFQQRWEFSVFISLLLSVYVPDRLSVCSLVGLFLTLFAGYIFTAVGVTDFMSESLSKFLIQLIR